MNFFGTLPEDLEFSVPVEPMQLASIGEQQPALKEFLTELVDTHATKLKPEERHRLRDAYRQILLNVAYNSIRQIYTAIPRGKASFDPGTYWKKLGFTYRLTTAALDRLHADEYIIQHIGFYNAIAGFGRLTRIYGTEKLSLRMNAPQIAEHIHFEEVETLQLKGFPYEASALVQDHPDVVRLRVINYFLKDYVWQLKGPIRLIYTGGPVRGGRVYTRFQNMPKALRAEMKINGEPTVELDFKSNHPMMLVAMSGMTPPADPYLTIADLTNQSRDKVKAFITVCLGANNAQKAFKACAMHRIDKELFNRLEAATLEAFPGIRLYEEIGVMLQSLEGQIALNIMFEGAKNNIPVLPVHDSFITTATNEQWLHNQMINQWKEQVMTSFDTGIEKK